MSKLLVGLLLASSAAVADVPSKPQKGGQEAPPTSVWRAAPDDTFNHLQSGLDCPARVGEYSRTNVVVFDQFGLDVGCNYAAGGKDITVYLTRRDKGGLDDALAEAKRELLQAGASKNPQALPETHSSESGLDWTTALYGEDGGLHTGIWMADLDGWTLEYRATYPIADETRVGADLEAMTELVRKTAGARLKLCGLSAPPKRAGVVMTDQKELESMSMSSSIIGGALSGMANEGKATEEAPDIWCVEDASAQSGRAMIFWRAVRPDGSPSNADQVTLATQEAAPTLEISPEGLSQFADPDDKDPKTPVRWSATMHIGKRNLIFGFFTDRPSFDSASGLFARIVEGKAQALGGYSADGKNITIITSPEH